MCAGFESFHQAASQRLSGLIHQAVAAQTAQIFIDADETECPCARRIKARDRRQCQCEELPRHHLEIPKGGASHAYPQRPERPAVAILRSLFVEPAPVET